MIFADLALSFGRQERTDQGHARLTGFEPKCLHTHICTHTYMAMFVTFLGRYQVPFCAQKLEDKQSYLVSKYGLNGRSHFELL